MTKVDSIMNHGALPRNGGAIWMGLVFRNIGPLPMTLGATLLDGPGVHRIMELSGLCARPSVALSLTNWGRTRIDRMTEAIGGVPRLVSWPR